MKHITSIIRTLSLAITVTFIFPHSSLYALDVIPEDLATWTEKGTVLTYGTPGSWDEKARGLYPIGVTKKDGTYYLHYLGGFDGCWNADGDINHRSVGLATSTDGINFTKHAGNPILKPHDFVSVSSHEEGIRTAKIRYLPGPGMWLGYFGVESPGGTNSCPFMGSTAQCGCNIPVDASIYAATSTDGISWTVKGEVSGVYNGQENYIDDFQYSNGEYYLWSHRAQGGQGHRASKGTDYMNLTPLGSIPLLCWGWSEINTFLHDDGNTVTAIYDPSGGCATTGEDKLYFAATTLDNMTSVTTERVIINAKQKSNIIIKDTENGIWRWYYSVGAGSDIATIQLRTHTIDAVDNIAPNAPLGTDAN